MVEFTRQIFDGPVECTEAQAWKKSFGSHRGMLVTSGEYQCECGQTVTKSPLHELRMFYTEREGRCRVSLSAPFCRACRIEMAFEAAVRSAKRAEIALAEANANVAMAKNSVVKSLKECAGERTSRLSAETSKEFFPPKPAAPVPVRPTQDPEIRNIIL